ncbi:MAG: tRNA (adenosine(37)-N6)-threonylcarbamoyltransferase complex ATPase subunit type 1 TsaE [Sulfurovaceae bacterium]|nr:tRNA (adenosine(37)-N6)-threonylcarbamoyltransferase complex ATPase subunit type 1 TsaE [Sulfurovaceae bacterium]
MIKEIIASLDEVPTIAKELKTVLPSDVILFLDGDLAAGKTTLTKAIANEFGLHDIVSSPTFSLQQCYGDRLFHYDLYRIGLDEMMFLGLHEEFDKPGWHIIEWGGDELRAFLDTAGYNTFSIKIEPLGDKRRYKIGEACIL